MKHARPAAGVSVTISPGTHARVVLACENLNFTVAEFMERAALASLQRQEEAGRVKAYDLACSAAEAARRPTPAPADFGLPRDHGIPVHP